MHHLSKKQHLCEMNSGFDEYFANVGSLYSHCTAIVNIFSNSKYLFFFTIIFRGNNFSFKGQFLTQEMFSMGTSKMFILFSNQPSFPLYRTHLSKRLWKDVRQQHNSELSDTTAAAIGIVTAISRNVSRVFCFKYHIRYTLQHSGENLMTRPSSRDVLRC